MAVVLFSIGVIISERKLSNCHPSTIILSIALSGANGVFLQALRPAKSRIIRHEHNISLMIHPWGRTRRWGVVTHRKP
jgi:hypothetical protein